MFVPRWKTPPCMNIEVSAVSGQSAPTTAQESFTSHGWNASSSIGPLRCGQAALLDDEVDGDVRDDQRQRDDREASRGDVVPDREHQQMLRMLLT